MRLLAILCAVVLLSGCTQMQLANHYYKKVQESQDAAPYSAPPVTGARKVGNPYTVMGKRYYPISSSEGYRASGIASWYGKDFHGKKTANGERYNMYSLTAAHTTLPLPTWVRVTNLENGRSVRVRVNDRGPFLRGRLIDMSYAGAVQLGMVEAGTAPVLVEALPTDGSPLRTRHTVAEPAPRKIEPRFTDRIAQQSPEPDTVGVAQPVFEESGPLPSLERPAQVSARTAQKEAQEELKEAEKTAEVHYQKVRMYVQTGAFGSLDNAERQRDTVQQIYPQTDIYLTERAGTTLYRVRVGPVDTVEEADAILAKLVDGGFNTAIIAVEKESTQTEE